VNGALLAMISKTSTIKDMWRETPKTLIGDRISPSHQAHGLNFAVYTYENNQLSPRPAITSFAKSDDAEEGQLEDSRSLKYGGSATFWYRKPDLIRVLQILLNISGLRPQYSTSSF
jgi:hypothetical protein